MSANDYSEEVDYVIRNKYKKLNNKRAYPKKFIDNRVARLHDPTEEQERIICDIEKYNVVVDSVAGSGKSTTILHIARVYPERKILMLTYNKLLRNETKSKVEKLNILNLDVFTFHGFYYHYYDKAGMNDDGIYKTIDEAQCARKLNYDLLIFDEAQDIRPILHRVTRKIYDDCEIAPLIGVFGDKYQAIYNNGDGARYITDAAALFNFNGIEFKYHTLSVSQRVPCNIVNFINTLNVERKILSGKEKEYNPQKIDYINLSYSKNKSLELANFIKGLLNIYDPQDIYILMPSVRVNNKKEFKRLADKIILPHLLVKYLSQYDPDIAFLITNQENSVSQVVLQNKLIISTIHQSKGMERKAVILTGFDTGYYLGVGANQDQTKLDNLLYVGLTRSTEYLAIIQNTKHSLSYVNDEVYKYCNVFSLNNELRVPLLLRPITSQVDRVRSETYYYKVKKLLSFLPDDIIRNAVSLAEIIDIDPPTTNLILPQDSYQGRTYEYIADYNLPILNAIFAKYHHDGEVNLQHIIFNEVVKSSRNCEKPISDLLQIDNYNWITKSICERAIDNYLNLGINENYLVFNRYADTLKQVRVNNFNIKLIIHSVIDIIDHTAGAWYILTDNIDNSVILQVLISMLLAEKDDLRFYLYSITTREKKEIVCDKQTLQNILTAICRVKFQ